MRTPATRLASACVVTLAALGLLSACTPDRGSSPTGAVLRVTERDFRIAAPRHVRAGDVRLVVRNNGPDAHELIVVRTADGRLPLRADGMTVNEEAVERDTVGVLEPGEPHSHRELALRLTPGRYVLLCNMSGHYLGGMHMTLVAR